MIEILAKEGQDLDLGKRGENLARRVTFDIGGWIKTFGEGEVHLLHQRNGDKTPYPCVVEVEKTKAYWPVTNTDVAMAGRGHAEIQYWVGDAIVKSVTYNTRVAQSMGVAGDTPPAPAENWLNTMMGLGNETKVNAEAAAESAEAAATSAAAAKISETNAAESESNAKTSEANAKASETNAKASETVSVSSAEAAAESAENAATSETNALAAADRAEAARDSIVVDEEKLAEAVENATNSADAAKASEETVLKAASEAAKSEKNAKTSETNAKDSETAAQAAKTAAESAKAAAEKARDEAGAIVGGDFATRLEAQNFADAAEENANAYTDEKIAEIPAPDLSTKVSIDGDKMTGPLEFQPEGATGYGRIMKNAYSGNDYGLKMQDVDADGNYIALTLSASLQTLEYEKQPAGDSEKHYAKIYDSDNPPTAEEVGALPLTGGKLSSNLYIEEDYAQVNMQTADDHKTTLMKNADKSNDYGTILRDTNGDDVAELKLSAANGNVKLAKNGTEYTMYHQGNFPTLEDMGAAEAGHAHAISDVSGLQSALDGKAASSHGTHVTYGTSATALGTSSAGTATTVSRSDHVHALPALTSCTGTLTVAKGGTGKTSVTSGSFLVGNGTNAMTERTPSEVRTAIGAAASSHNQAASTITAGTFAGAVVANSSGQTYSTSLLRNSKLVSAETNPTVNGEINWTYG